VCTDYAIEWAKEHILRCEVEGKRVLEVGAYDINGSLRDVIEPLKPTEYVGTDLRPGPGVDVVCRAEDLVEEFGINSFDVVLTTCTLEHIKDWQKAVSNMKQICRSNGIFIIIVPSREKIHLYPGDFWRYQLTDVRVIFSDCEELYVEEKSPSPRASFVYAKFRKPDGFIEKELLDYKLYSIVVNKKIRKVTRKHFITPRFFCLVFGYIYMRIRPKIAIVFVYIIMGVKLKLIEPCRHYYKEKIARDFR
jgi:SAM-dependent methyltransferase